LANRNKFLWIAGAILLLSVLVWFYWEPLARGFSDFYQVLTDREKAQTFISTFGIGAPIAFMVIQVLQVIFAPIPGEATGFIGGYLFGTAKGFLYSSIALTIGSWINFSIGRFLGKRYVRKLIPERTLARMDFLLRHQGVMIVFIFFVIPGFPKDYLSLFLGITALPFKAFILLAAIGRMPGTLMLSIQGASIFDRNYSMFGILFAACLVIVYIAYRYRESLYRWIEKQNHIKS
jgi:uncharacterized membrane protein YdjX (TVP38/TMEM64 family)